MIFSPDIQYTVLSRTKKHIRKRRLVAGFVLSKAYFSSCSGNARRKREINPICPDVRHGPSAIRFIHDITPAGAPSRGARAEPASISVHTMRF
ncbi:hypothetical protein EVAR_36019_1 [Eumeta japonica]|uniref:Uncharacterized protein n=1 Tax=Eumeta variegata TaxID=151549 RepID=A0A4C1WS30_EUMVA|nr:hypothetical protein EVAR_36019_1 [Eumeta japonica]